MRPDNKERRYTYYPEQVAALMVENELIGEDERTEMARYIRGCA